METLAEVKRSSLLQVLLQFFISLSPEHAQLVPGANILKLFTDVSYDFS
jgi:hypothetical protein